MSTPEQVQLMFAPGPPQNPYGQQNPYNQPPSPSMPPYNMPQSPFEQQANPYGQQNPYGQPSGPPQRRQGGGCGRCLGCGCLSVFMLLLVVGIGGYFAVRNGNVNVGSLLKLIGQEQPHVEVNNLRDDEVFVLITQLDTSRNTQAETYGGEVSSLDIVSYTLLQPGRYRVDFGSRSGRKDLGSCTIQLDAGATYQFVPLPDQIVVNDLEDPVSRGRDLVLETSSLCK